MRYVRNWEVPMHNTAEVRSIAIQTREERVYIAYCLRGVDVSSAKARMLLGILPCGKGQIWISDCQFSNPKLHDQNHYKKSFPCETVG